MARRIFWDAQQEMRQLFFFHFDLDALIRHAFNWLKISKILKAPCFHLPNLTCTELINNFILTLDQMTMCKAKKHHSELQTCRELLQTLKSPWAFDVFSCPVTLILVHFWCSHHLFCAAEADSCFQQKKGFDKPSECHLSSTKQQTDSVRD